jgi:hypothetical protein
MRPVISTSSSRVSIPIRDEERLRAKLEDDHLHEDEDRILEYRERHALSRSDIAKVSGCTPNTVREAARILTQQLQQAKDWPDADADERGVAMLKSGRSSQAPSKRWYAVDRRVAKFRWDLRALNSKDGVRHLRAAIWPWRQLQHA